MDFQVKFEPVVLERLKAEDIENSYKHTCPREIFLSETAINREN